MIEVVAHEKLYKDVKHESLRPTVPKDPRTLRASSTPAVAPSRTTHTGGASSAPRVNSGILKMFRDIFATCWHMDQCMYVMEQCLQIVRHNQKIIHSQRDELHFEFLDVPVFLPIPKPYASLTAAELVAFGIGPVRAPNDDDDDEEEATNDNEETEDDE
jgi:hypothetical protein